MHAASHEVDLDLDGVEPSRRCLGAAICYTALSHEAADAVQHLMNETGLTVREALASIVEDWARRLATGPHR